MLLIRFGQVKVSQTGLGQVVIFDKNRFDQVEQVVNPIQLDLIRPD